MNKIICSEEKIINLNIEKDSIYNICKDKKIEEINIRLENDVKLIINHYSEIIEHDLKINIMQDSNSEFIYNHSFLNEKKYNLNIFIDLVGNNSKNIININGISDNGKSIIVIDGKVNEFTNDNVLDEKVRMLNINEGMSNILPNMYINTKNVIANHAASVTNINEDYLFYLNSKGIKSSDAKKLIIDGFLKNDAK